MPKKTKTPAPIRPELIEPLTEILRDRGLDVRVWPKDEAAAYRNAGGFRDGHDAVLKVRMAKAAAAIEEVIKMAQAHAYIDGVAEAQYMTGFTDETFQSILNKSDYPVEAAGGVPKVGH